MESASADASMTASTDASSAPPELDEPFSEDPVDDGGAWEYAEQAPTPPKFTVPGDVVTRLLCSTAHLKGGFADHVLAELVEPNHRAMAPNWNLDTVALVRHAQQASNRRSARDLRLLLVFALIVAVEELALGALVTGRLAPFTYGLLAVLALLLAWLAAFAIVWSHYSLIHRSSLAVVGNRTVVAEEPAPVARDVEERLLEAQEANVVLFSGASPFVGSGELLDRWSLTVDLGAGAPKDGNEGARATPEPFDTAELHDAMLAAVPQLMSPAPRAGHRLYVVGGHALAVGGLFRSGPVVDDPVAAIRFRRPVGVIRDDVVRRYLNQPAASARPYAFFELTAWDGQVVVTMFLRVVVTHPTLFVEVALCALRPPQGRYGDVGTIRLGEGVHRMPILRAVLPATTRLLVFSPARAWRGLRGARADRLAHQELELTLRERNDVNFSAGPGLREEVARGENPLHFGHVDEEMFYRSFSRAALDSLQDWLIDRRIDISEFTRQRAAIEDRTQAKAQSIYGKE
jgi:hypothetical protein